MEENTTKKLTKGDYNKVIARLHQVNTITLKCPVDVDCVDCFYSGLVVSLSKYEVKSENGCSRIDGVPVVDILNVLMASFAYCDKNDVDYRVLSTMFGIMQTFKFLKFVNFEFVKDSKELEEIYMKILSLKKPDGATDIVKQIYTIDRIVMTLSDMFEQPMIDDLNKMMMFDGIISDSYLSRQFEIDFSYDEYCSYIEMVFKNNFNMFNKYGEEAFNYLFLFPSIFTEHKPRITIVTNYSTL